MFSKFQRKASAGLMAFAVALSNVIFPVASAFATGPVLVTPVDGKITICHSHQPEISNGQGLGPQDNPYNQETVSVDATDGDSNNDHTHHTGVADGQRSHVYHPGDLSWGDIIPAYDAGSYTKGNGNGSQVVNYPASAGLNWDAEGQAIYFNGCALPVEDAAAAVVVSDATCKSAGVATVTIQTNATLTSNGGVLDQSVGTHTATFTANTGHYFTGYETTFDVQYTVAPKLADCTVIPTKVPLVPPATTDECNPADIESNIRWTDALPADTATVTWMEDGATHTRTATLVNTVDYSWEDGSVTPRTFQLPADNGELCDVPDMPVTPEQPTVSDLCGRSNDTFELQTTAHITYTPDAKGKKVTIVATPVAGYSLDLTNAQGWTLNRDGSATYTFSFTNTPCEKVTICHRTNAVNNPYRKITVSINAVDGIAGNSGNKADHYSEHQGPLAISEAYAQSLKDQKQKWGDIIPPIEGFHSGRNWPDGQMMYDNDCAYIIETTPETPTAIDLCYTDKDYVVVPSTKGITYLYDGQNVNGQSIPYKGETIFVTAVANKGYTIASGAKVAWTFAADNFSNQHCLTIVKTAKTATDTNRDGSINAGDTITWEITVTNTSGQDLGQAFYVEIDDPNAILENDGRIDSLAAGESKTLTATSIITSDQVNACKATNTANFSGWRIAQQSLAAKQSNVVTDTEDLPLAIGSVTAEYALDCGKGDFTPPVTPTTPEVPSTPEAPALLPYTSGISTLTIAISALSLASIVLVAGAAVRSRLFAS